MISTRTSNRLTIAGAFAVSCVVAWIFGSWALFWFLCLVISLGAAHAGASQLGHRR